MADRAPLTVRDLADLAAIAADRADPAALFAAADALVARTIGHKLFTVMRVHETAQEVERLVAMAGHQGADPQRLQDASKQLTRVLVVLDHQDRDALPQGDGRKTTTHPLPDPRSLLCGRAGPGVKESRASQVGALPPAEAAVGCGP